MTKVFLGGTTADSSWRKELIEELDIDYFDPVVKDWNKEAQDEEIRQRKLCDFCLYVITPKMKGVYSVAEVVDDSNKRPHKTIFCYLLHDGYNTFSVEQTKSLAQVGKMVQANGSVWLHTLSDIASFLNKKGGN